MGRLPQSEKREGGKCQAWGYLRYDNSKCYVALIMLDSSYIIICLIFTMITWNRCNSFYNWGKWGPERLNNLPRVTQLVSGRAEIWTQAASLQWLFTPRLCCLHVTSSGQELRACWTWSGVRAQQKCHKGRGSLRRQPREYEVSREKT